MASQSGSRSEQERPTATEEDLRLVRTVCQMVTRQFYSDQHVITIDILSKYSVMPADILAQSLGVHTKDLLQVCNQLVRDRLIGIFKRGETRETATATSSFTRTAIRNYFYLDRKVFLDVTKWRMMKMRSQIDSVLRNELDNKGYMCPRCGKSYNTLDVAALLDPITMMTFICNTPGCGSELVDNEDAEDVKRSKDRLKRFNEQCGPILDRLRKIDSLTLPSFDVETEIRKTGTSDEWKLRARQRTDPNATLRDVQEAQGGARRAASVEIDMVSNDPALEAARREQREREAERQLQENALPSWWETTQDPNAPKITNRRQDSTTNNTQNSNGTAETTATNQEHEDYLARYASMAQEGEDDDEEIEYEDVVEDDSATPSGPSTAQTPSFSGPNGKRSREDSLATLDPTPKKAKIEEEEDDEEELEFEDVT
jgi:transcription initiation factor TFIIE subunit alpha